MSDNMTTKIIIADDHKILREGLVALLQKQSDVEVVGETSNGRTAVELTEKLQPGLVIMDVAMPDLNGVEATRQIVSEAPGVKVLGLSMHADSRFVTRMLQAGASGYLLKDCAFEELTVAIQTVLEKRIYLSPDITGVVVRSYVEQLSAAGTPDARVPTAREREVLQLLAEGKTTKDIAGLLHISVKTVETHRKQLMNKLDLHSVAELTKYAVREGLTTLDSE